MTFKGYELSDDYDLLWKLIKEGVRVPAWIIYSDKYSPPIYDLVEVKINHDAGHYMIGCRGKGYELRVQKKESFLENCADLSLKYVKPTKDV